MIVLGRTSLILPVDLSAVGGDCICVCDKDLAQYFDRDRFGLCIFRLQLNSHFIFSRAIFHVIKTLCLLIHSVIYLVICSGSRGKK